MQRRGDDPHSGGAIDVPRANGDYIGTLPAGVTEMPDACGTDGLAAFLELDELDWLCGDRCRRYGSLVW